MAEGAIIARVLASPLEVDATAWNALLALQSHPTPFMRHEYLAALHESESAVPHTGWTPRFMTLWEGDLLVAACPLYLKSHSYGEYVFDWAWASAYEQHGVPYYPKAVVAVPFTPVPGTRLMARDAAARQGLVQALCQWCEDEGISSLHVLFASDDDVLTGAREGLMLRHTVQFHWKNVAPTLGTDVSSLPPEGALAARGGPSPLNRPHTTPGAVHTTVAVVAYPRISNLDEFQPLKNVPGLRLQWVRSPADVAGLRPTDWIVLPGSKATAADLAWLRAQGLDQAIAAHAGQGGTVLGVCGGLQMLGEALIDPEGIDGNGPGLGLLPLVTVFEPAKTVQRTAAQFGPLAGAWAPLSGVAACGYEIHHGQTAQHPAMAAKGDVAREVMPGIAWQNPAGNVLGVYLHGLFEDAAVLHALFGAQAPTLETVFDGLADGVARHFDPGVLDALIA